MRRAFAATETPRLRALDDPTTVSSLRRWWSKRYRRPPNDPLFEAETETYWMTEFYLDALDEAQELKHTIEGRQGSGDAAGQVLTRSLLARFRRLQALLRGEEYVPAPDTLAEDIAAQKRGDLPAFIARKLASERAGTARVVKEDTSPEGKAARMAQDRAAIARHAGRQRHRRGQR